jgi:hypothetical protein
MAYFPLQVKKGRKKVPRCARVGPTNAATALNANRFDGISKSGLDGKAEEYE